MKDYLTIGSSPVEEECAQVGSDNYSERAREECKRFIELIRKVNGEEPPGARLSIKSFPHDFGNYYEVVCYFDDADEESMKYAFDLENNSPLTWEDRRE